MVPPVPIEPTVTISPDVAKPEKGVVVPGLGADHVGVGHSVDEHSINPKLKYTVALPGIVQLRVDLDTQPLALVLADVKALSDGGLPVGLAPSMVALKGLTASRYGEI